MSLHTEKERVSFWDRLLPENSNKKTFLDSRLRD